MTIRFSPGPHLTIEVGHTGLSKAPAILARLHAAAPFMTPAERAQVEQRIRHTMETQR